MPLNRSEGLRRLEAFTKSGLAAYAARRNSDLGPDHHQEVVSLLSPYLARRLLVESECIKAALAAFPQDVVSKWIDEVIWRIYWRGWLEHRPTVWMEYVYALEQLQKSDDTERALDDRALDDRELYDSALYDHAIRGRSGIACFDAWADELRTRGYLHNHARMWFASIWIYTLRLPWQLGAQFFLRHLIDGDPAVNTLSWRWVAGLHTQGKRYVATAENIKRCTDGRVTVRERLATDSEAASVSHLAFSLDTKLVASTGEVENEVDTKVIDLTKETTLIVHADDLYLEGSELKEAKVRQIIAIDPSELSQTLQLSPLVSDALAQAVTDGVARAKAHFGAPLVWAKVGAIMEHVERDQQLICMKPHRGYWSDALSRVSAQLDLRYARRGMDTALYPHATKGFFQFRSAAWAQNFGIEA